MPRCVLHRADAAVAAQLALRGRARDDDQRAPRLRRDFVPDHTRHGDPRTVRTVLRRHFAAVHKPDAPVRGEQGRHGRAVQALDEGAVDGPSARKAPDASSYEEKLRAHRQVVPRDSAEGREEADHRACGRILRKILRARQLERHQLHRGTGLRGACERRVVVRSLLY